MAVDLQIVYPQSVVHLNQVRYVEGAFPRTLDVTGTDFSSVDDVRVNSIPSPSIVVVTPQRMLVQVPDQVFDRVTSVTVLSNHLTLSPRSLLAFRLGRSPTRVAGVVRLMQRFIKLLFTTPGTDIWNPESGGGALRSIGKSFAASSSSSVTADFYIAVDRTARQMIAQQSRRSQLPLDEALMRATVTKVTFDKNEGALLPTVELVNQVGAPIQATLEL